MSVVQAFKHAVSANPAKTAAICGSTRLTFSDLEERVNRFSACLTALGIEKNDRVAVLSLNCHRYFELYYAIPQAGAVIVPINFRIPAREVKYILDHSESVAIAVDATMRPIIDEIRGELRTMDLSFA